MSCSLRERDMDTWAKAGKIRRSLVVIYKDGFGRGCWGRKLKGIVRKAANNCVWCSSALLVKKKDESFQNFLLLHVWDRFRAVSFAKTVRNHGSIVSPIVASSQVSLQNPRAFRDLVETSGFCWWVRYALRGKGGNRETRNLMSAAPWLWTGQSIPTLQKDPEVILRFLVKNKHRNQ